MGFFSKTANAISYVFPSINWGVTFASSSVSELVSTYFTCVKTLSDNIGQLTPQVVGKDGKVVEGHYLNSILGHKPNSYTNKQKYASTLEYNRAARGNSLAYIERDTKGKVKALHALRAETIQGALVGEGDAAGLYYGINFSQAPLIGIMGAKNVRAEDICHFLFAAGDDIFATSPSEVLKSYTNVLEMAGKMINSFLANNATSGMAVQSDIPNAALLKETNKATESFIEKYTGVQNAGKPIHLPPNTKIVPISQKFTDAQLTESQEFAKQQIGDLFGIPDFMIGSNNSDLSIEQQTLQFLRFTMAPALAVYTAEYEYKLLTAEEIEKGYKIAYDIEKLIETDIKTKVEVTALQVAKGLLSPDAGAIKLGNDPIDSPYGKFHFIQTQNQPIEEYNLWSASNTESDTEPEPTESTEPKPTE